MKEPKNTLKKHPIASYINMFTFFCEHRVEKKEDMPEGPFYMALLFDSHTEWTPAYDDRDTDTSSSVPHTEVYTLPDDEVLKRFIELANEEKKKFVFFKVEKLGKFQLQILTTLS